MKEEALPKEVLKTTDFVIINGGHRNEIDVCTEKYYAFYRSGSGQGGQADWCVFHSRYTIYKQKWGELTECGFIDETVGTGGNSHLGEINGHKVSSDFFSVSDLYVRITSKN